MTSTEATRAKINVDTDVEKFRNEVFVWVIRAKMSPLWWKRRQRRRQRRQQRRQRQQRQQRRHSFLSQLTFILFLSMFRSSSEKCNNGDNKNFGPNDTTPKDLLNIDHWRRWELEMLNFSTNCQTALLCLQQMALQEFSPTTSCRGVIRESRWHVYLVIRTHVSTVAPDWELWRTLYQLSYSAAANIKSKYS